MKRFVIVVCLASVAFTGSRAVAADLFPWWFHTRPKPVLLEEQPANPANARTRTTNQSTDFRRTNVVDERRVRQSSPASKPWLTDFLTRGWRTGTQRSK
jgi:hypothetical protein